MNKSKILSQLRNKILYIALIILLIRLVEISFVYLIPVVFILYFVIKRFKYLLIYSAVLLIFIAISISILKLSIDTTFPLTVRGDIKNVDITSFTATQGIKVIKIYTDSDIELHVGDVIEIKGDATSPINQTIPGTFDYKHYLLSKRISQTVFVDDIKVTKHRWSLYQIREYVNKYIDRNFQYSNHYLKTFILADKSDFDEEFKDSISILGISHLFAVSGLHIGLLTLFIEIVMKYFKIILKSHNIIFPVLIVYLILTGFSPSVVRAVLMYGLIYCNKKFDLKFSMLDILSIIFIFLIVLNPYAIYNIGFSLSFLVTLSILLGQYLIQNNSKTYQIFVITLLSFLFSLPIIVSLNYEFNLLSLVINIIFIYGMTFVILPFGYLTFFVSRIDLLYYKIIFIYEKLVYFFAEIDFFRVDFVFANHFQIILYYVFILLIFSAKKEDLKKYIFAFIIFIVVSKYSEKISIVQSVSMIDIYGDSILVKDRFDQCNILIDTGISDDYDSVISFIKKKNVKRIDYLIITHPHDDHMGELNDILDKFQVINLIDDSNVLSNDIECGNIKLHFFQFHKVYNEVNNKSLVFELSIADDIYLFTGDMEYQKEEEFNQLYDVDVTVLKSGHHGSITSSSEEFLSNINAEDVWISCYRKNLHGHPHEQIISRYNDFNMNIYRTDQLGTIEQYYIFSKHFKKYHRP